MLEELYRRILLGDSYINADEIVGSPSVDNFLSIPNSDRKTYFEILNKHINTCRLCSISKLSSARVGAFVPKVDSKLAFVVESLSLDSKSRSLYENAESEILGHVIEKDFGLLQDEVFIIPLIKCVDVADSSMVRNAMSKGEMQGDIKICLKYLFAQLELLDFAVLFGARLCKLIFDLDIKEANGKLIPYKTKNKTLQCICVESLSNIVRNSSALKEASISFKLLKGVMGNSVYESRF